MYELTKKMNFCKCIFHNHLFFQFSFFFAVETMCTSSLHSYFFIVVVVETRLIASLQQSFREMGNGTRPFYEKINAR